MSETRLESALRTIAADMAAAGVDCALVGGLAVSVRTEPRFTRDVDLAVAVADDEEAGALVRFLTSRGYVTRLTVEQEAVGRLATVRLTPPGDSSLYVDLLFASSGIEPEIVAAAEPVEIVGGLVVRVATLAHLIATKVLARDDLGRPQDRVDLAVLLGAAGDTDVTGAREALGLIRDAHPAVPAEAGPRPVLRAAGRDRPKCQRRGASSSGDVNQGVSLRAGPPPGLLTVFGKDLEIPVPGAAPEKRLQVGISEPLSPVKVRGIGAPQLGAGLVVTGDDEGGALSGLAEDRRQASLQVLN